MHIVIFNIMGIGLLIIMGAESSKALVTQVSLNRVNATNQHVESAVKLLLINNQRIVNIALDEILVMERRLGQVSELFQQDDTVTATALRRLGDERLSWILSQVMLEVSHFVRQ